MTVPKPVPSASAVAVALAAAQLFVYDGSCRWRSWLGAATATHAAVVAASAVLALPKSLPLAAALVNGRLTVPRLLLFVSITSWRPMQLKQPEHSCMASCSKLPVGPRTATARPAASLRPAPSSSSPSSRKGATESDQTSAAPALLLLLVHAR